MTISLEDHFVKMVPLFAKEIKMATTNERLDVVEADVANIKVELEALKVRVSFLEENGGVVAARLAALEADVSGISGEVVAIDARVDVLETEPTA